MMSEESRGNLMIALWFVSALVLGALFISAAAQGVLTLGHILLAFVILALAAVGTTFIWRWQDEDAQPAKAKRQRIDRLLKEMSDEKLNELKRRLSDGDFSDESIKDYLGDDGELVQRR
jgi:hypothetical protein